MIKRTILVAALASLAAIGAASPSLAREPAAELQRILGSHAWYGERVSNAVRAATGDPNITVIDRRWEWGEIYSCNYHFMQGKRVLICD